MFSKNNKIIKIFNQYFYFYLCTNICHLVDYLTINVLTLKR